MARNDLELAKSLMTAEQLQTWAELRSRNEVADYGDSESVHQIISKDDYDSMRSKVEKLKLKISKMEKLPFDQVKRENEALQQENSVLGEGSQIHVSH